MNSLKKMVSTIKTVWLLRQMAQSLTLTTCSASIHPITQRIEERQEKKIGKIYYPANGLSTDTIPFYTSAYDMDMRKLSTFMPLRLNTLIKVCH